MSRQPLFILFFCLTLFSTASFAEEDNYSEDTVFDDAADFFRRAGGQRTIRKRAESLEQSFAILESLFGGRVLPPVKRRRLH